MPHAIRCQHCSNPVQVADNTAPGTDIRCPSCRKLFKSPAAQPVAVGAGAAAGAPIRPNPGSHPRASGPSAQGIQKPNPSAQGTAPRPAPAPAAAPRPAPAQHAAKPAGGSLTVQYRPLLEAVSFAARAHKHHLRKDDKTPYVSHVFRVTLIVRHVFGIDDTQAMMAAVLHDTIEDTTTDWDDLDKHFGTEAAHHVAALSKDKRRPEPKREEIYRSALSKGDWQVQVCKLADIFDNLLDIAHTSPDQRAKTIQRSRDYLMALNSELKDQARKPFELVSQLLAEVETAKS
ncbi:MAG: bifunctional (p)ppGpp synthetase/guanosine-3',5'-bis(diphosphate) 3'-pyrophosphohydrolase [Planctomycetia bacterium]|nr:bifunctional (p)ppGpp synthetase/guanosine-3',5'-bis(diphosphate) 3'-pyrophosphohydrolase [Planctomycetia bacterium]